MGRRRATRDSVAVAYNTRNTRNTVGKGTVWLGYGHPKPVPVPEHTRDHIITVLAVPVSCLNKDEGMCSVIELVTMLMRDVHPSEAAKGTKVADVRWRAANEGDGSTP